MTKPELIRTPFRVLDAEAYYALQLSALAFGGVGAGTMYENGSINKTPDEWNGYAPFCAYGHAYSAEDKRGHIEMSRPGVLTEIAKALLEAFITTEENDRAVRFINRRAHRKDLNARVPFEEWCAELDVIPSDDPRLTPTGRRSEGAE